MKIQRMILAVTCGVLAAMSINGQGFTNEVDMQIRRAAVLTYNNVPANPMKITEPLTVFMEFEGVGSLWMNAGLYHDRTLVNVFSFDATEGALIQSPLIRTDVSGFEGLDVGGNWQLIVDVGTADFAPALHVTRWGVTTSVPEPQTWALGVMGIMAFVVGMNRKRG
jgi:hypothetical protein